MNEFRDVGEVLLHRVRGTGRCKFRNELASLALCLLDALLDELPAVLPLGEQLVVGAAHDVDVRGDGRSASSVGILVMELEHLFGLIYK